MSGDIITTNLAKTYPRARARTPFYASTFLQPPGHMKIASVINPAVMIVGRIINGDFEAPEFEFDEENAAKMLALEAQ
jgi:hypothetical protein